MKKFLLLIGVYLCTFWISYSQNCNTPTVDALSGKKIGAGNPPNDAIFISWTHTVTPTANDVVVVVQVEGTIFCDSVRYAGTKMTLLDKIANGPYKAEMWYTLNPPPGTSTVVVNYPVGSGSFNAQKSAEAISIKNVDQTTPFGNVAKATGNTCPSSLLVRSDTNELVLDMLVKDYFYAPKQNTSQTKLYSTVCSNYNSVTGSTKKGADSTYMKYDWSFCGSEAWATLAVPVKPSGCIVCVSGGVNPTSISSSTGSSACAGTPTTLTQVGGTLAPGARWHWFTGSCGGTLIDSGASIVVSPSASTIYFVKAVGDSCPTKCTSITLNTSSVIAPVIYGNPSSLCIGQTTTLSIVNSPCVGGGCNYLWSPGGGTGMSIVVSPTAPITYTATVSNGCGNNASGTAAIKSCGACVTTGNNPTSISSSTGTSACPGSPTTLTQVGGVLAAGARWHWYTGSCGGTLIDSGASIVVTPTGTTTYYVKAVGDSCITTCKSITLNVSYIIAPVIYGNPSLNVCNGSSVTLDIVNSPCVGGGCTYVWSNGSTGLSIVVNPTGPTTYTVTITNSCGSSVTGTVNICGGNPTGVSPYDLSNNVSIVPNPSNGVFTIYMGEGFDERSRIKIYNLLGDELPFSDNSETQYKKEISLNNNSPGIYFIRIESHGKIVNQKLIIESGKQ